MTNLYNNTKEELIKIILDLKQQLSIMQRDNKKEFIIKKQIKILHIKPNRKWSKELKMKILLLRDKQGKSFSEICHIMNLNQRNARCLYGTAKVTMGDFTPNGVVELGLNEGFFRRGKNV